MFCRFGSLRAKPAGRGDDLIERGVNAAGRRVDHRRQRIDVGALELGVLAVLDDLRRQRVQRASSSSTSTSVLGPVLVRLTPGSFSSSKQQSPASCLGESMLNCAAGELVDLAFELAATARRTRG